MLPTKAWELLLLLVAFITVRPPDASAILGGRPVVSSTEYPYIVSLQLFKEHFCAGSILNNVWIVTAAHCFVDYFRTQKITWQMTLSIRVGVGTHIRRHKRSYYSIDQTILHPHYEPAYKTHDIALIKVRGWINYDETTRWVDLPKEDTLKDQDLVTVVGWGIHTVRHDMPRMLHEVNLPLYDETRCRALYDLQGSQICTNNDFKLHEGDFKGVCMGDSGGPVLDLQRKLGGRPLLVGVVSASVYSQCGLNLHDFHTKVHAYLDWINSYIHNTS